LEIYLRCFASAQPVYWVKWFPLTKWCFNTSYHTSIKMTPFEALYGQPPPIVISYILKIANIQEIDTNLSNRGKIIRIL